MKYSKIGRLLLIITLSLMVTIPLWGTGCASAVPGTTATALSETMVPPVDLDVYIYINQQVPTNVPASLTGAPMDIAIQSMAIWGIVNNENQYTIASALTFTSAADASAVFTRIPQSASIYTKLTDRTIYVLRGSGGPAESIKNAIASNNLKKYDDKAALAEVARLPSSGTIRPGLVAIVKPNQAAVKMVQQYLGQSAGNTVESIFSNAKPEIIVLGLFSSQPIDLVDVAHRVANNTIWDMDLGLVVSVKSVYPGIIFSPIASRFVQDQGFPEATVGDLTAYKDVINIGNSKNLVIYLNVSGNHIFAAASAKEAYAQSLLTGISR